MTAADRARPFISVDWVHFVANPNPHSYLPRMVSWKHPPTFFVALLMAAVAVFSIGAEPDPTVPSMAEAGAAIPQPAGAHTQLDYARHHIDWCRRCVLPPLREAAKGRPWDAAAVKFAEDSIAAWLGSEADSEERAELAVRGRKLLQDGCDDPVVRYYTAEAEHAVRPNLKATASEYRRVLEQLEKDRRYPRAFASRVARSLEGTSTETDRGLEEKIVALTREGFEEGSYAGKDDVIFVGEVVGASTHLDRTGDATEKMVRELKDLPEWARRTILGKIEIHRAWEARGSGWADSVKEEGWKGFGRSLDQARAELVAAWKLRPDQPYAAKEMITVTMGGEAVEGESLRLWFDRTVQARFDFLPAYDAFGWALRPRWGGSHEEMLAFGRACLATKRLETDVPRFFRNMIDAIASEQDEAAEYYRRAAVADEVMAMHRQLVAAPTGANNLKFRLSDFLVDAWICRRFDDTRKALDKLPDHKISPNLTARMKRYGGTAAELIGECLILTSPARDDYAKARELDKDGHYADAVAHYEAALKKCGPPSEATGLLKYFVQANTSRLEFDKGQWLDISPKAADHGDWSVSSYAQWNVPEDGTFTVSGSDQTTYTRWHRPVGENYELRASFEFLPMTDPPQTLIFSVELGATKVQSKSVVCQFYSNKLPDTTVQILRGIYDAKNPTFQVKLADKNDMHIQCWNGRISLYLNGKAVFENFKTKWGNPGEPDGEIGFGGYKMSPKQTVRISRIGIRKLSAEPGPPVAPAEK